MNKFTHLFRFVLCLFDDKETLWKATQIIEGILKAHSTRLSDIARENEAASYKYIQRFVSKVDPRRAMLHLFQSEAPFVIGDPTEMPRPQAKKTDYVGTLSVCKSRRNSREFAQISGQTIQQNPEQNSATRYLD